MDVRILSVNVVCGLSLLRSTFTPHQWAYVNLRPLISPVSWTTCPHTFCLRSDLRLRLRYTRYHVCRLFPICYHTHTVRGYLRHTFYRSLWVNSFCRFATVPRHHRYPFHTPPTDKTMQHQFFPPSPLPVTRFAVVRSHAHMQHGFCLRSTCPILLRTIRVFRLPRCQVLPAVTYTTWFVTALLPTIVVTPTPGATYRYGYYTLHVHWVHRFARYGTFSTPVHRTFTPLLAAG